jgi:tetratricopeptide (TPR) repeat protein
MAFRLALAVGWVYTQRAMATVPPLSTANPPAQGQPDPELQTAVQYLRAGWFDRAEPLFRSAHGRYGDRPDVLHYLAVCLSERGALADAEAMWRKALAKDPNEPMLSYNLGLMARRLGRPDEAAKRFRDTIRRAPTHVEARLALASVHLDQGRFAAAERELAEFVQNVDRAIQQPGGEVLKLLQARARNMLGHALYRMGHYGPAIEVLDMALQDAGDDAARQGQILGDRALALGGLNHHDEAIAEAERALALAPQSASLNHVSGFILYFAGRPSDAIAPIQKALELDPTFTPALKTLALAQTAAGQTASAVEVLRRALRHNPADRDAVLQLSFLQIEQSRFAEALETLEPFLKAAPNDVRALNNQGLALRGVKRHDEARRTLKRASRLAPDDPLVLTNLGAVLLDLGRASEARALHEHALRGLPGDPRLLANYGTCLAALGEHDRARETLDAALASDPSNKEALAARAALDDEAADVQT